MPLWLKQFGDPSEVENYRMARNPEEYRSNQLSYLLTFIAADVMTSNPITVNLADDVSTVSLLMIRHGISGLPVVQGKLLAGIITKTDIVRALLV
jgi:predicted transcriptional regulator